MDAHTLRVLEFEKVLNLLADEAAFSVGRELALAVRPETDYPKAFELQAQTAEMRLLDQLGIDVPFSGAHDVRPHIHAASIGQPLEPGDLLEAVQTLRTAHKAHNVILKVRDRRSGELLSGVDRRRARHRAGATRGGDRNERACARL